MRDKVAFITGGSSGIGLALATRLVAAGAHVALFARGEGRLQAARQQLVDSGGSGRVAGWVLDVGDGGACRAIIPTAVQEIGAPHLLVHCAGVVWPGYFADIGDDQYETMMRVNVGGIWHVTRAALPWLIETGASIVNVSSMGGLIATFGYTAYAASKYAVVGLSEALRNELRPQGVRVHVVCPPDTDTPQLHAENLIKPPETKAISAAIAPISADRVARSILRAIRRGRFVITPGLTSTLFYFVKRLLPRLIYAVIDGDVRKVRRAHQNTPASRD